MVCDNFFRAYVILYFRNGEDLAVRESAVGSIHVEGLTEKPLTDLACVEKIVDASISE